MFVKPTAHLASLHLMSIKKLQIVQVGFNYMKITVCGEISLFQIDDNSVGMHFSTTQTRLCHSTKHLLYPPWQRLETVLMQPPSCLSQTRGRRFIITRCLTVRLHYLESILRRYTNHFRLTFSLTAVLSSFQFSLSSLHMTFFLPCQ